MDRSKTLTGTWLSRVQKASDPYVITLKGTSPGWRYMNIVWILATGNISDSYMLLLSSYAVRMAASGSGQKKGFWFESWLKWQITNWKEMSGLRSVRILFFLHRISKLSTTTVNITCWLRMSRKGPRGCTRAFALGCTIRMCTVR